jgi:hypothetical protein
MLKFKYSKLYWFLRNFEFLKVYFSPFKFFLPKLYIGKTAIGVPMFYPRKFVKATPQKAIDEAVKEMRRIREHNSKEGNYKLTELSFRELYDRCLAYRYPQPKKFGFDFVNLGWKTKYDSFRHEWNPVWSFVCFGYQIALIFRPEDDMHYWECYLAWNYDTVKSKSAQERLKEAKEKHPCVWTSHSDKGKVTTDYWTKVIKEKYL